MPHSPGNRWDVLGNTRLLKYAAANGPRLVSAYPGRQRAVHRILNQAKHSWAKDMWDAQSDGQVPSDKGEAWWNANMRSAEEKIAQQHSSPQGLEADGGGAKAPAPEPTTVSFEF